MCQCLASALHLTLHMQSRPTHQALNFHAKDTVPAAARAVSIQGSAQDALLTGLPAAGTAPLPLTAHTNLAIVRRRRLGKACDRTDALHGPGRRSAAGAL